MRLTAIWLLLALLLARCAGTADQTPTATTVLRLTPAPSATNALMRTDPAGAAAYPTLTPHIFCPGTMESFLIVGERGRVTRTPDGKWLNLRAGPSTEFDIIDRMAPLAGFLVLDGARCDGPYSWFQVEYRGAVGWIAEGADGQYFAEPWLPG